MGTEPSPAWWTRRRTVERITPWPRRVIELPVDEPPIVGVPTAVAAFIGVAERGPERSPVRLTSLADFTRRFGGPSAGPFPSYLALAVEGFFGNGGSAAYATRVGSTDAPDAVRTDIADHLALLAPLDEVSIVAVPGLTDLAAQQAVVEHCQRLGDRIAVLDAPPGVDVATITAHRTGLTGSLDQGFAALYYPWIVVPDPAHGGRALQPPSGHVAGSYATSDRTRGVHRAPANLGIVGAVGLERILTDAELSTATLGGVNGMRRVPGRELPVAWGARTTADDPDWRYVPVRRLMLYLEHSLTAGLAFTVFEPDGEVLRERVTRRVADFLLQSWRDGLLSGQTPDDAFFVRVEDADGAAPADRLDVLVGVSTAYPGEFRTLRIRLPR